jgi:hypothetical protein
MYQTLGLLMGGSGGGGGGSGYPAIVGTEQTCHSSGTSRVVNLPAPATAGQMILITSVGSGTTITPPGDYTTISAGTFYKIAIGGETSCTVTAGTSSGDTNFIAMLLSNAHLTTAPEFNGSSSSVDPPSLTASWGAANNLCIALVMAAASGGSTSGYPSNCTLYRETFSAQIFDGALAAAETLLATFDPATFTSTLSSVFAKTIMVRGA